MIYNSCTVSEACALNKLGEKNPTKMWHRTWETHLALELIHLFFHRSLIRNGLSVRVAIKKAFLRRKNREKRLRYVKSHKNWTGNQCLKVLWRDASKCNIFILNCYQYVPRRLGERYITECLQLSIEDGLVLHFSKWCWGSCQN